MVVWVWAGEKALFQQHKVFNWHPIAGTKQNKTNLGMKTKPTHLDLKITTSGQRTEDNLTSKMNCESVRQILDNHRMYKKALLYIVHGVKKKTELKLK